MSYESKVSYTDGEWDINGMSYEQAKQVMEKEPSRVKRNMVIVGSILWLSASALCWTYGSRWSSVNTA